MVLISWQLWYFLFSRLSFKNLLRAANSIGDDSVFDEQVSGIFLGPNRPNKKCP